MHIARIRADAEHERPDVAGQADRLVCVGNHASSVQRDGEKRTTPFSQPPKLFAGGVGPIGEPVFLFVGLCFLCRRPGLIEPIPNPEQPSLLGLVEEIGLIGDQCVRKSQHAGSQRRVFAERNPGQGHDQGGHYE